MEDFFKAWWINFEVGVERDVASVWLSESRKLLYYL